MTPPLDDLVAEYLAAAERGQAPDPADFVARHPAHAAALAAFLADLGQFGDFLGLPPVAAADLTRDYAPAGEARRPGERFGEYELLGAPIGEGGMGVVYRARLAGTGLVVALKQIRDAGAGRAERFREEIETAAGLRHPNIVPVYHVGEHAGRPFFTMALVEGGGLDRHLARFRGDPAAAAALVAKVARAVHHAHQRRVLHRDLKPSNILLDEAGEPHVADFGLAARLTDAGATVEAVPAAGSLPWMAPEAVRGEATLTTAADVWALGVILYELLAGARPFVGADARAVRQDILDADPLPPRTVNPAVPRDLDAVCRRCLEKDPDKRYESASAVALELDRWRRDEPVRARRPGRGERVARWSRRNPGVAAGALLLAGLLVVATAVAVSLAREQDAATRRVVCEDNEHAAELAAGAFLRRIDQHRTAVLDAASQPALTQACAAGDMAAATRFLRARVEAPADPGVTAVASMYVLDDAGTLRAVWPETSPIVGENFSHRDYYRGAKARDAAAGRGRVHLSKVFKAKNDGLDKLAVAVAFRPAAGRPAWVLAAAIPTDPTLGLGVRDDRRHKVVLLAPRDPEPGADPGDAARYFVVVHPDYARGEASVPFPADGLRKIDAPDGRVRFAPDDDYRDPVHPDGAAERWLAGFAPVEGTDLVVLVQQTHADAVGQTRSFFRRFFMWTGGAVAAGPLAVGLGRLLRARGRPGKSVS